jgi:hypothetical protein
MTRVTFTMDGRHESDNQPVRDQLDQLNEESDDNNVTPLQVLFVHYTGQVVG